MVRKLYSIFRKLSGRAESKKPDSWRCFSVADGKIMPPYCCEVNAVDHCNIACMDCNHASPAAARRMADPEVVFRDFSIMATFYGSAVAKIIGGEPLLHPDLPALIKAVRESGISNHIILVTNGTLLPGMSDAIWEAIDELELSVYPETELLLLPHMPGIQQLAERHRVKLVRFFYEDFRATFSTTGPRDKALTRRIYKACEKANLWGCQSIREGYFFKCPQCIYIPGIIDQAVVYDYREDGVRIDDTPECRERLKRYLASREPLRACRYCLGTVGRLRKHVMAKPAEWASAHSASTEELIDYDKLSRLEKGRGVEGIRRICLQ
jgi:GTP 3',8-cyclase